MHEYNLKHNPLWHQQRSQWGIYELPDNSYNTLDPILIKGLSKDFLVQGVQSRECAVVFSQPITSHHIRYTNICLPKEWGGSQVSHWKEKKPSRQSTVFSIVSPVRLSGKMLTMCLALLLSLSDVVSFKVTFTWPENMFMLTLLPSKKCVMNYLSLLERRLVAQTAVAPPLFNWC